MRKLLLSTVLIGLCLSAQAETYKCVAGGKVRYTNRMPGANDKCSAVFARKLPTAAPAAVPATEEGKAATENDTAKAPAAKSPGEKTLADKALEDKLKKASAEEAEKKNEVKEAQQKAKQQNCKNAKTNVATLQVGRVSRVNEKGEKYFLDDATIAKELEQANKEVEKWCGE